MARLEALRHSAAAQQVEPRDPTQELAHDQGVRQVPEREAPAGRDEELLEFEFNDEDDDWGNEWLDEDSDDSELLVDDHSSSESSEEEDSPQDDFQDEQATTWMLSNIPEEFSRDLLLKLLTEEDFVGAVDFLFMPVGVNSGKSVGHAFVNFVTPEEGCRFGKHFRGFEWPATEGKAPAKKQRTAKVSSRGLRQGLEANIQAFRNDMAMHESFPDECRPILMWDGQRIPFPPPTEALIKPAIRRIAAAS